MYASRLARDPAETYRQVDLASRVGAASRHGLVVLLYDDLLRALRLGALAIEAGDHQGRSDRLTRALAILFALEAGLDFDRGGEVAATLSRFYRGARETIMRASVDADAQALREVVANIAEIAQSWRAIGG